MHYLITGGTGFIGNKLIANLLAKKQKITILTRNASKAQNILSDSSFAQIKIITDLEEISSSEVIDNIINLAGEPIAEKKWSKKQKEILLQSRILTTKNIIRLISRLKTKPKTLINASAIGFYGSFDGDKTNQELTELSPANSDFSSILCQKWEEEANKAQNFGVRVCIIRLGIVLEKNGGILKKILPAFKMGLGGKIGDGKQFMSWIHLNDVISGINFLTDNPDLFGIFNLSSPNPVSNYEFTKTLAKIIKRPAFFDIPKIIIKITFGEMGENLLLKGQKVIPQKLINFQFSYTNLEKALLAILSDAK